MDQVDRRPNPALTAAAPLSPEQLRRLAAH